MSDRQNIGGGWTPWLPPASASISSLDATELIKSRMQVWHHIAPDYDIIVAEMNILPFVTPCKPPQYSLASPLPDLQ